MNASEALIAAMKVKSIDAKSVLAERLLNQIEAVAGKGEWVVKMIYEGSVSYCSVEGVLKERGYVVEVVSEKHFYDLQRLSPRYSSDPDFVDEVERKFWKSEMDAMKFYRSGSGICILPEKTLAVVYWGPSDLLKKHKSFEEKMSELLPRHHPVPKEKF